MEILLLYQILTRVVPHVSSQQPLAADQVELCAVATVWSYG